MADASRVCAMCGDVGFPDKIFQCMRCFTRFQHSNYYEEQVSEETAAAEVCDWCLSEERSGTATRFPKKHAAASPGTATDRSVGSSVDHKVKRSGDHHEDCAGRGKSSAGSSSSSKPAGRRYKLLKDVL